MVAGIFIEFGKIQTQQDGEELTLGNNSLGNMREREIVFANGVCWPVLQPVDIRPNGVKAIVVGINRLGAPQKGLCLRDVAQRHMRLRGAKLQMNILPIGVGSLRISAGRLLHLSCQLVGVGQVAEHVGGLARRIFQGCDGRSVIVRLAEIIGDGAKDFNIARIAALGLL